MLTIGIEERCTKVPWSGCWIWEGATTVGYGCFRRKGKTYSAHRVAYEQFCGPVPEGLHVLHECDVRACCNPRHLFLGTNMDNIKDSAGKQRRFRKLTPASAKLAADMQRLGKPYKEIAEAVGVHTSTIHKYLRRTTC